VTAFIGISCCQKRFDPQEVLEHAASDTYVRAVADVIGAIPLLIPATGERADIDRLLCLFDGIILTGSYSNVGPGLYGGPPHPEQTLEDPERDGVTLPLIREAVARGVPLLGICRGFQELNVALGGTLHQNLGDLADRLDHWTPLQPLELLRDVKAHPIDITPGGWLHGVAQTSEILVNSHHNQGIDRIAPGVATEAIASDGTIEAIRVAKSPGFAIGVQWHPEYDLHSDQVSRRIFESFGDAVETYRATRT
jgi:putative glutamine amidotransferase